MGTAQLAFEVELCGGATGSDVTGSDMTGSDMTGSDVSHVTGSDVSHVPCLRMGNRKLCNIRTSGAISPEVTSVT